MSGNLNIKNLSVNYGDNEVLKNININLIEGEVTILLGLNGAGKTTLIKSICNLNKESCGEVLFNGKDLLKASYKDIAKLISYIPQNINSNQNYTVKEIIVMGITPYLGNFEMPNESHYNIVNNILKELKIEHIGDKTLGELSGGERRIAYLGRILIQNCKILLLDEPNTFLDYIKQHDFFDFLKKFIVEKNLISLITLHDINLALKYGDRIIILNGNKIEDNISCKENGYDERFLNAIEKIYNKKFTLVKTDKGPFVIC